MYFNKLGLATLTSGLSLLMLLGLSACATRDLSIDQNLPERDVEFTFKYFSGYRVESLDGERKERLEKYNKWLSEDQTFEQGVQGAIDSRQTVAASVAANLQRDKNVLEKYQAGQSFDTNQINRSDQFQRDLAQFESQRMDQTQRINEAKTQLIEQQGALRLEEIKAAFAELGSLRDQQEQLEQQRIVLRAQIADLEAGNHSLSEASLASTLKDKNEELDDVFDEMKSLVALRAASAEQTRALFGDETDPNGRFVTTLSLPSLTEVKLTEGEDGVVQTSQEVSLSTNVPQAEGANVNRQIGLLAEQLQGIDDGIGKLLKGDTDADAARSSIVNNNIDSSPLERIRNKEATLEYLLERKRDNQLTSTATLGGYVQRALPFEIGFHPGTQTRSGVSARVKLGLFEEDVAHVSAKVQAVLTDRMRAKAHRNILYIQQIRGERILPFYEGLMACANARGVKRCQDAVTQFTQRAEEARRSLGVNNADTDFYRAWMSAIRYVLAINQPEHNCEDRLSHDLSFDGVGNRRHRIVVDRGVLDRLCRDESAGPQTIISGSEQKGEKNESRPGLLSYVEPFSDWRALGKGLQQLTSVYGYDFSNVPLMASPGVNPSGAKSAVFEFIEQLAAAIYTDVRLDDSALGFLNQAASAQADEGERPNIVSNIHIVTDPGGEDLFEANIKREISYGHLSQYLRFLISPKIVDNAARERVIEVADTEAVSRVLNAAISANEVSGSLGANLSAEVINALARSTAFKVRLPYATPFTGMDQAPGDNEGNITEASALSHTPYFGWTFYQVPTGIGANGGLAYQFKAIPAQSTVVVTVPQWLRRIKAVYQYRHPGEGWRDHGVEAINLSLKGASFDQFSQFIEYEIFDIFPDNSRIHPTLKASSNGSAGQSLQDSVATACDNDAVIRVSRHSDQFALCGERLYGVRNLIIGGLMLASEDLTRVSDNVMLVNAGPLTGKACLEPSDPFLTEEQRHRSICDIALVHEEGISKSSVHFVWIDDQGTKPKSTPDAAKPSGPKISKLVLETVAGLNDAYRVIIPYRFNKDNPIRSIFIDKRYPFNLTKRNKTVLDGRIEHDIAKSHLMEFCADTTRTDCIIDVFKSETLNPEDVKIGFIDMADYGFQPYRAPRLDTIKTWLSKTADPEVYRLNIRNYAHNAFFPLRYVRVGNSRLQSDHTLANRPAADDIEFDIALGDLQSQCVDQLSDCELAVSVVEKYVDQASTIGKVRVPIN